MSSPRNLIRIGPFRLRPAAAGAWCCVVSVLGYSAANVCMCRLSRLACEPVWAICNKELVAVAVVGPWLLWKAWRRQPCFPRGRPLAILIAAGLTTELVGNIGIQWGYEVVGMAVMTPANTGFVIVSTAVLGGVLLGEQVSLRNLAAIGVLLVAVALLGVGVSQAGGVAAALPPAGPAMAAAAIFVAAVAGVVYSLLGIAIRHCVTGTTTHGAVVVIITGMGVATLGPLSVGRLGVEKMLATPAEQFALMFAAGVCNLVAFLALVRGLHLTTVLHVNMINAGQVALAAVAGVALFGEPCNRWLVLGVGMLIAGIFSFGAPTDQEAIDAHV